MKSAPPEMVKQDAVAYSERSASAAGSVERYMAAIRSSSGKSNGDESRPPHGAYQHHSFCDHCQAHKPPHAHHCRCKANACTRFAARPSLP